MDYSIGWTKVVLVVVFSTFIIAFPIVVEARPSISRVKRGIFSFKKEESKDFLGGGWGGGFWPSPSPPTGIARFLASLLGQSLANKFGPGPPPGYPHFPMWPHPPPPFWPPPPQQIGIPIKIPFPVPVDNPIPVPIIKHIPIHIDRFIPVPVDRPVPFPVHKFHPYPEPGWQPNFPPDFHHSPHLPPPPPPSPPSIPWTGNISKPYS